MKTDISVLKASWEVGHNYVAYVEEAEREGVYVFSESGFDLLCKAWDEEDKKIILELSSEQARVLRDVCSMIAGNPNESPRHTMDVIAAMLDNKGVRRSKEWESNHPSIGRIEYL